MTGMLFHRLAQQAIAVGPAPYSSDISGGLGGRGVKGKARLIDYARTSHADHIIIGARGSSGLRRLLGSVSARVAAEAPCTVTVVRAAHAVGILTQTFDP